MFEDRENFNAYLRNPMALASETIKEIQNRLGGSYVIADPNSPSCHLLEFASSVTAHCMRAIEAKSAQIYPHRALTMEDLEHHMSDFDFLKMYASPSSTKIKMMFPKPFLMDQAVDYNENYKKLTIPKDTVFTIGRYTFGIYYPVDILINNFTKSFTVIYDTSETNPLHTLTTNIVDTYEFVYQGITYLVITLPIYQFSKSVRNVTVVPETGFATKYIYNDKFYAVRIFSYSDGTYTELSQTQSAISYDPTNPTALVQVLPDSSKVKISIPQVFMTAGAIGTSLMIEIYTTEGDIDIDTSDINLEDIHINFALNSPSTTKFSAPLQKLPFDLTVLLDSEKINGGSNAISFTELRERVVNNRLYDSVPITEEEITDYLEDRNFTVKKYTDNVTDRVFHAFHTLVTSEGTVIPSCTGTLLLKSSYVDSYDSFVLQSDNSITILPNTFYVYNSEGDCVVPLTNEELTALSSMTKAEIRDTFNNKQYFKSPFHMRVSLEDFYPQVVSFNLMTPKVNKTIFSYENYDITYKMLSYESYVSHEDNGIGSYLFQFSVYKSDDVKELDEADILVYVLVKTKDNYWIGAPATYAGELGSRYRYVIKLNTNYHLTLDEKIGITNWQNETIILQEHLIPLTSNFHLVFMVRRSAITGTYADPSAQLVEGIPSEYTAAYVGLSRQYVEVELGYSLADVIRNDLEASTTSRTYMTWNHDVLRTYEKDVYAYDEEGNLVTKTDEEGNISLEILHKAGDTMLDEAGLPLYLHKKGDVLLDADNNPVVSTDRSQIYYTDLMLIDAKIFASEKTADTDFVSNIWTTITGYLDILRELQEQMLERTNIFFRCGKSTGTATFNLGDGITSTENIEMSFKIRCYVKSYVKQSTEIQRDITTRTINAISDAISNSKTLSMLDIFEQVKSKMSDYIDHFDLLGINGNTDMQTFNILDEDAKPSIRLKLVLTEDNILTLARDIDISFAALEDNTETTTYTA